MALDHAPQTVMDGKEPQRELRGLVGRERVRRSPGSMPSMRIGAFMILL
jgi:hypothetical protein